MVCATKVTVWKELGVVWALGLIVTLAAPARGWAQDAVQQARSLLDELVARAGGEPGTYVMTETGVEPSSILLPVVAQGDVMRGPVDPAIRLTLALGAIVARPATVDMRVVRLGGPEPVVAGQADGTTGAGIVRLVREYTIEPGEYEVWAAVGHPGQDGRMLATLTRSTLAVPDVWRAPLAVTPLVISDAVGAAQGPSAGQAFRFGTTVMGPATRSSFPQHESVNVAFRIYNWTAEASEGPDLTVEYVFYQQLSRGPVFFNKIASQPLNADTLGPSFDPTSGQVSAGMAVPLASFPFGEFELRVRVTDKRAGRTTEQQTRFRVSPS